MESEKFKIAEKWFINLRNELVKSLEDIDSSKFSVTEWNHKDEGGGKMSILKGSVIEKGGVNFSSVAGKFNDLIVKQIPGTKNNPSYKATGISVVLHPHSPNIPSMHFNTRYLKTQKSWFGGGIDFTPCLSFAQEKNYHSSLKELCDKFNSNYYPEFKKNCDNYFFLKHRKEPRGIGGIFFDYLNSNNWEHDFQFVKTVGEFFKDYSINIINNLKKEAWTESDKNLQLLKRSRYVEFNLLYDRGTKFGLETGGNTDAIMMSMPPLAKWE